MFFNCLSPHAVSAKPTSKQRTQQQLAKLGLAAAMAVPSLGLVGRLYAAEPAVTGVPTGICISATGLASLGYRNWKPNW